MENINPYNQEIFQQSFQKTSTFLLLKEQYDIVYFNKFTEVWFRGPTPRHGFSKSKASAVPFYYLNYLDSTKQIFDLGCGMNFFKPYFPDLIGIGAEDREDHFFGDEHDFVDNDYYRGHVNTFNSVFSINALHFHPLEYLKDICINFSNMLKPGGRGFLALNAQRMVERSDRFSNMSTEEISYWIRSQFVDFPCKILVFDLDLSQLDAWMDGNIRIVFEK